MIDPFDDEVRAALRAETEGVTADDALLDRVRTATVRERSPWRQRGRWVLAAVVVALVAGLAAVLMGDDADQTVDLVDDSTTSTTAPEPAVQEPITHLCRDGEHVDLAVYMQPNASEEDLAAMAQRLAGDGRVATNRYVDKAETYARFRELFADQPGLLETVTPDILPTAYLVTLVDPSDARAVRQEYSRAAGAYQVLEAVCEDATPVAPEAERPTLVALVREDGWLVTVDLRTGEERQLYSDGDPNDASLEGGPYYIDAAEISPDGDWIYFSTCCEPASGNTYRIPVTGGEPELVAVGGNPRVSPDGQYLATAADTMLIVSRATPSDVAPSTRALDTTLWDLTWSPDGTQLAFTLDDRAGAGAGEIQVVAFNDGVLTHADTGKPVNPGRFASWTPDGTLVVSDGDPIAGARGLSQDSSYGWLLWVDEDGSVREQDGHASSDRRILEGLPEAIAADW